MSQGSAFVAQRVDDAGRVDGGWFGDRSGRGRRQPERESDWGVQVAAESEREQRESVAEVMCFKKTDDGTWEGGVHVLGRDGQEGL